MTKIVSIFLWMTFMSTVSVLGGDLDRLSQSMIRKSDIPSDAPLFEDHFREMHVGDNAPLKFGADPMALLFKTRLRQWNRGKVNFAGHYILASWGCGAECVQFMVIDVETGITYHQENLSYIAGYNIDPDFDHEEASMGGHGSLHFRPNSGMLMVVGAPNEDESRRGISYYLWRAKTFQLMRFIPKPTKK